MCGIAGIFDRRGLHPQDAAERLQRMTDALRHRGPDDEGHWIDAERGIGLGFRRLAILELSPLGAQPMKSRSGRYTIVFNGEVYNYLELAEELAARKTLRGGSDTEVILAAFEKWGIQPALERFVGMFAMAVWDASDSALTLARDRLGIKPLFYTTSSDTLLFASELKAFFRDPAFDATLDLTALSQYLQFLYVPAPRSVFQNVVKLPPGCTVTLQRNAGRAPVAYWSPTCAAENGLREPLAMADDDVVDLLEEKLSEAVRVRLRSDVPLGVLLSGGIDSSVVAALAQAQLDKPVKTFSIGFDVAEHDESAHARTVAATIGCDHTEMMVTSQDAMSFVPRVCEILDEPLADPSAVPTLIVSELARRSVTVALGGDGGDELFGGYNRYVAGERWIRRFARLPAGLRRPAARAMASVPSQRWDGLAEILGGAVGLQSPRLMGEKTAKLASVMARDGAPAMYAALLGAGWSDPNPLLRPDARARSAGDGVMQPFDRLRTDDIRERMLLTDQCTYLSDDLLAKVDRTSMSVSLEVRVPILDHRLVEFSWRLPMHLKIRDRVGKWALRQVLFRHVPREIVDRPKVGFTPPVSEWLRTGLREWAGDLLFSGVDDAFDEAALRHRWAGFHAGRSEYALGLWAVVQWRAWSDTYARGR